MWSTTTATTTHDKCVLGHRRSSTWLQQKVWMVPDSHQKALAKLQQDRGRNACSVCVQIPWLLLDVAEKSSKTSG